jgi:hypothetical protein
MKTTITAVAALIFLFSANATHAQSGALGSASSPVANAFGRPMAGVNVSICQPLATTAAQVISNTAVLTMAGNPLTVGFAVGMMIQVSGFSGADTYFNGGTFTNGTGIAGGYTILAVTSATITYSLTHANASASSNGTVLQQGNATTGCAGLSAIYSDPGMTQPITQPPVSDALGNWNAFAPSGQLYYVQFYGPGVTTSIRWMVNVTMNAAVIVASGTSTLGNSAIGSGSCATAVSTSASGVLTSDRIEWAYASAPATADGLLTLSPYVTSGTVNWKLCNPTASSQTPSGLIVNWEVLR